MYGSSSNWQRGIATLRGSKARAIRAAIQDTTKLPWWTAVRETTVVRSVGARVTVSAEGFEFSHDTPTFETAHRVYTREFKDSALQVRMQKNSPRLLYRMTKQHVQSIRGSRK